KLAGATVGQLLEMLKLPEMYSRQQAKRVMAERGAKEVAGPLGEFVKGIKSEDPQAEHLRLEALWTYESINVVEPALLKELLASKDARVRAAAVRTVSHWHDEL